MKIDVRDSKGDQLIGCNVIVSLSRRNLLALLLMIEKDEPGKDFIAQIEPGRRLRVIAEKDERHYSGRDPGTLHGQKDWELESLARVLEQRGVCD